MPLRRPGPGAIYRARGILLLVSIVFWSSPLNGAQNCLRVNQAGYLPSATKVAILSSSDDLAGLTFTVVRVADGAVVFGPAAIGGDSGAYCSFAHNYRLAFSALQAPGTYVLRLSNGSAESHPFTIGLNAYAALHEEMLKFLRAQRCGANPFIPATCHAAGAAANIDAKCDDDGVVRDMSGGWHDAGDYIKFLLTASNVVDLLLFSYNENKPSFADNYLSDGTEGNNGIPDILDEAKHGLDWMLKLHPAPSKLYYQVGGAPDHENGWRLPQNDTAAYGLGGYRPAYHGVGANIAGRAAAAFAMAYKIWNDDLGDPQYAAACLAAALELYSLAKANLRAQDGTPSYYYDETFYYDDLELAAIELYKATGEASYLEEAQNYSSEAGSSWGWFDWGNMHSLAHYELYPHADAATRAALKGYLRDDLDENLAMALSNPYRFSTDYGWGSVCVMTGTVAMCNFYRKLFPAESTYNALHDEVRDYIMGKNQWGVSWIIGAGDVYTRDPHHQIADILARELTGACIEGPMSLAEWQGMNITLSDPDEYAAFQSAAAVYHDDVADWATNEPTIYQAALTICALAGVPAGELDSDSDGLSDGVETQYGTSPLEADSDGDGVGDGDETDWNADSDGDGLINARDADSDNDSYTDYMEAFYGTDPLNAAERPSTLRIDFKPSASESAAGCLVDSGGRFASARGYGW